MSRIYLIASTKSKNNSDYVLSYRKKHGEPAIGIPFLYSAKIRNKPSQSDNACKSSSCDEMEIEKCSYDVLSNNNNTSGLINNAIIIPNLKVASFKS
uniref:Uncharacterized protein n=1 Tax=Glossina brevipalpis TaxID=37001 RepID=A0A1A9W3E9_9MUSC